MNYKITITPIAKTNLQEIKDYIANDLQEPKAAYNTIRNILAKITLLSETPFIYPLYEDEPWHSRGIRHFPVNNYVVIYWVDEQTKTVSVLKIIYGRRDISFQLKDI